MIEPVTRRGGLPMGALTIESRTNSTSIQPRVQHPLTTGRSNPAGVIGITLDCLWRITDIPITES